MLHDAEQMLGALADSALPFLASQFVFEQFCFKDPRFISESEVRISRAVLKDPNAEYGLTDQNPFVLGQVPNDPLMKEYNIRQRNGPYGVTRFIALPLVDERGCALKSVGFGPKCAASQESRIRADFSEFPGIEFWRSDLPIR
jgi:hypothetical protein